MQNMMDPYESPFTWDMDEQITPDFDETELLDEEEIPLLSIVNSILVSFIHASKGNHLEAEQNLENTLELWKKVDKNQMQKEGISTSVVYCILQTTQYCTFMGLDRCVEADQAANKLKNIPLPVNPVNKSTLNGCKSVAWSIFHESGMDKAISFAKSAIEDNPHCPMWHFILGKNLRRFRRAQAVYSHPSAEEITAFVNAYNMLKNPLFGIYVAQAYQENRDYTISDKYLMDVFEMKSKNCKIQLRLALSFMRKKLFDQAKICLDFAGKHIPDSSMFLHYRGMYYMKLNDYEVAVNFLEKAAVQGNIGAALQYCQCMSKIDNKFDSTNYLISIVKCFENKTVPHQKLLLQIGMELYHNQNYTDSLTYLIEAIKLKPNSDSLKNFFDNNRHQGNYSASSLYASKSVNIYNFIEEVLVPECRRNSLGLSFTMQSQLNELKNIIYNRNIEIMENMGN